ncbi:hypothetical protein DH2020_002491 [Rehmannia glutinosa]|uniref:PCI domain-containing protein n=1 Tax=Rehmannia glutinosa TaxID=99300 RepID=A0ABR0XUG2_REHGL
MDIEQKQAEHIDYFVKQASNLKGSALSNVVVEATSHPSLFAFSEILSVSNVLELEGTENSVFLDLLRMFAHGTWSEYKSKYAGHMEDVLEADLKLLKYFLVMEGIWEFTSTLYRKLGLRKWLCAFQGSHSDCVASRLPQLVPDQVLKLKQLTLLTLAEANKVLPYDTLMQELDVTNVRELEDFLINDCMYVGIVRGKLDQLRRCFEVQFAAGRDLRPGQLGSMIQTLANWLSTSESLLVSIQEKIKWADTMSEVDKKHRKELDERVEEVKKTLSLKLVLWPTFMCDFIAWNLLFSVTRTSIHIVGMLVDVSYVVAEVTNCKQADVEFRGHEDVFSEHGGVMDFEEDRSRRRGDDIP